MLKHPKQLKYIAFGLPKGKSGHVRIAHQEHPAGKSINIVSMRTAIFTGQKPLTVTYDKTIIYTALKDRNGTWMTNTPEEQMSQHEELKKCKGKILVGGLGLGYFAKKLQEKENVSKVIVIEISKHVINLVWKYLQLDKRFSIVNADIKKYLRENKRQKFDWVYLDIWRGTGESTFIDTVLPLKRLVFQTVCHKPSHILSWQEDVMLAQIQTDIQTRLMIQLDEIKNLSEKEFNKIFRNRYLIAKRIFYNYIRQHNLNTDEAMNLLPRYIIWIRKGMNGEFNNERGVS